MIKKLDQIPGSQMCTSEVLSQESDQNIEIGSRAYIWASLK